MKKILILAFYFPPCNSIGSVRPNSFAENFAENGLYPTVITRHWKGDETVWEDYQQPNLSPPTVVEKDSHTVISLPYFGRIKRLSDISSRFKLTERMWVYLLTAKGIFSPEINADECFYNYLRQYLKDNPQDYILATSPPINSVKLASRLAKEFNLPLIVDFRDLWNIHLTSENYKPDGFKKEIYNKAFKYHIARWLKNADLIVSVSDPLLDEISKLAADKNRLLITNGFEKDLFARDKDRKNIVTPKFTFSSIGSLFLDQNIDIMLEGLNNFLDGKDLNKIELNFIGALHTPEVAKRISDNLPEICTSVTLRIPRDQAIKKTVESNVLFFPAWQGYKGLYSGKIFEYLGAGQNILIAPSDNDVIEDLIKKTKSGKTTNSSVEFTDIMNEWFAEWESQGYLTYEGDLNEIEFYTRENQARILAEDILKL